MIVTQDYFDCYVHILRENGSYGDSLLTILEDIINGEWDRSVAYRLQYKDVNYDPMDDFNYPGSRHHYWYHTEYHWGGRDAPFVVANSLMSSC